jgi:hypothetical protein
VEHLCGYKYQSDEGGFLSMPVIHSGSCVGVLYWNKNKSKWAVHNGRLVSPSPLNTDNPPNSVTIAHWTIAKKPHAVPHKEIRHLTGVREVELTPDFPKNHPKYCAKFRGKQNTALTVYPGKCFGVYFVRPNGVRDVKNGRYVYWERRQDPAGSHRCVLRRDKIGDIANVYYFHYYLPKHVNLTDYNNPPKLKPGLAHRGIKSKEDIVDVYRTTLNPLQQP